MEQLSKITAQVNELSVSKSSEITVLKQQMFLLQNRLEELGEASGVRDGNSWQGQDGTTYFNNNDGYMVVVVEVFRRVEVTITEVAAS